MKHVKDPGAMDFSRNDISSFSYDSIYEDLLKTHPLLMHVIIASMSKDDISCIKVVYPKNTEKAMLSISFLLHSLRTQQDMVLEDQE